MVSPFFCTSGLNPSLRAFLMRSGDGPAGALSVLEAEELAALLLAGAAEEVVDCGVEALFEVAAAGGALEAAGDCAWQGLRANAAMRYPSEALP
jgi:hypothetical protein